MTVVSSLEASETRVEDLRADIARVRAALDHTDAILGVAETWMGRAGNAFERAESALVVSRRWAPRVALVVGVAAVAATAIGVSVYVWRRSAAQRELSAQGNPPEGAGNSEATGA
jgi:hypothetical protein